MNVIFWALIGSALLYWMARLQKRLPTFGFLDPLYIALVTALITFVDYIVVEPFILEVTVVRAFIFGTIITIVTPLLVKYFPYPIKDNKCDENKASGS